jgi:hypothetical protein
MSTEIQILLVAASTLGAHGYSVQATMVEEAVQQELDKRKPIPQ